MRVATNWQRYYQRVRFWYFLFSKVTLPIIWRAYLDLLRGIHFQRPVKIIELGCGTGYNTRQISRMFPVEKVSLIDHNPDVLNVAREKLSSLECEKKFILQDLFKLDTSEKYDIAHSQGLLEHYTPEEQVKLISLHKDLLTEEGVAIIVVPTPSLAYRLWRGAQEKLHLWLYSDERAITEAELISRLEAGGMQILKMKRYHLMEYGAICRRKKT